MNKPGFRRTSRGGLDAASLVDSGGGGAAPFSQAQILHLMKTEFGRARRHGQPLSCVLVRADRLGRLAEIHGSELREVVRKLLGRLVVERTRDYDHVGLANEDSYLLVLPAATAKDAAVVAERLREAFDEAEIEVGGQILPMSISCGIASAEDRDTLFFDTLVTQAEMAVDQASEEGGDTVVTFRRAPRALPE